jgi:hypothetical protein
MKHEDIKKDKAMLKKAIGQHDAQQHGGKKTKLALKKGGVTGEAMRKVGRNMARANNQRGR